LRELNEVRHRLRRLIGEQLQMNVPWLVCRVAVTLVPTSEPLLSVTRAILPFPVGGNGTGHADSGTIDHMVHRDSSPLAASDDIDYGVQRLRGPTSYETVNSRTNPHGASCHTPGWTMAERHCRCRRHQLGCPQAYDHGRRSNGEVTIHDSDLRHGG